MARYVLEENKTDSQIELKDAVSLFLYICMLRPLSNGSLPLLSDVLKALCGMKKKAALGLLTMTQFHIAKIGDLYDIQKYRYLWKI